IEIDGVNVTVDDSMDLEAVAAAISAETDLQDAGYSAAVDGDGNLVITNTSGNVTGVNLTAIALGQPADSDNYVAATSGSVTASGTFQPVTDTATITVGGVDIALNDTSGADLNTVATAINGDTNLPDGYTATVVDNALVITNTNGDVTADLSAIGLNTGAAIPAANAAPATADTVLTDPGSIDVNGVTVSWTAGQTMQHVLDQFETGELANVKAELGENGRLTLTSKNGENVKLADVSGGSLQQLGLKAGETKAVLQENTSINLNGTEVRLAKGSDMDAIVTAINTASTGVSASANEDGTLKLFSGNESFTVADGSEGTGLKALGLTDVAGEHEGVVIESSISNLDITTAEGAQQAISVLDGAMQQIDSERARLGAVQNRFESTISNLQNIAENASAARSRVLDTDYAAESANLAKNQIMQQAGTAMLAQANQLPQAVLSL